MKKVIVFIAFIIIAPAVHGEWGVGDRSCYEYIDAYNTAPIPEKYEWFAQWTMGYITAISDYVPTDPPATYSFSAISNRLAYYCSDTGMRFADAVRKAVNDVYRPRQ